jgi:3'(2'), 5'-bisphosphate nucleotidase
MTDAEHASLAEALIPIVLAVGAIEMSYYAGDIAPETKADNSPVTAADREAEVVILEALARIAPGIPVIAEEAVAAGQVPRIGETFFLVDPLDGTREFINKRDEFTVNIALIERGAPIFGIVYAPALSALYVTVGAGQAMEARAAPAPVATGTASVELIPIRAREPVADALVAVASRSHSTPETETLLAQYPIASRRNAGSSLKFCLLARGEADVYPRLGPTCEWDIAAGHAVLAAAGGSVTQLDGSPMRYGKHESRFLNPHFIAWGRHAVPPIPR